MNEKKISRQYGECSLKDKVNLKADCTVFIGYKRENFHDWSGRVMVLIGQLDGCVLFCFEKFVNLWSRASTYCFTPQMPAMSETGQSRSQDQRTHSGFWQPLEPSLAAFQDPSSRKLEQEQKPGIEPKLIMRNMVTELTTTRPNTCPGLN